MWLDSQIEFGTDRAGWLKSRHGSIGSSEAAALWGLSPWTTRHRLWEMKSRPEPTEFSGDAVMKWGKRHEPAIIQAMKEDFGFKIRQWPQDAIIRHRDPEFRLHSTPDAIVYDFDTDEPVEILEVKFITQNAREWSTGVPIHYQIQAQVHLEVADLERCRFGVLFWGYDLQQFVVERDRGFGAELRDRVQCFWSWVESKVEPPFDEAHPADIEVTKRRFAEHNGETVALDVEFLELDARRVALAAQADVVDAERKSIDEKIRRAIGNATYGQLPNGVVYTRTSNNQLRRRGGL